MCKYVNNKGFLLFEVMVSIVIITAGIMFIMRSYATSKEAIERSGGIFRTSLLLEEKMWEYEAMGEIREEAESGDFDEAEGYAWKMKSEPPEGEEFTPRFNIVRLSVFKEKKRKSTEYSLWTYLRYKRL